MYANTQIILKGFSERLPSLDLLEATISSDVKYDYIVQSLLRPYLLFVLLITDAQQDQIQYFPTC